MSEDTINIKVVVFGEDNPISITMLGGDDVLSLKKRIQEQNTSHPDPSIQKLIFSGRCLENNQLLSNVFKQRDTELPQIVHLVVRKPLPLPASNSNTPQFKPTEYPESIVNNFNRNNNNTDSAAPPSPSLTPVNSSAASSASSTSSTSANTTGSSHNNNNNDGLFTLNPNFTPFLSSNNNNNVGLNNQQQQSQSQPYTFSNYGPPPQSWYSPYINSMNGLGSVQDANFNTALLQMMLQMQSQIQTMQMQISNNHNINDNPLIIQDIPNGMGINVTIHRRRPHQQQQQQQQPIPPPVAPAPAAAAARPARRSFARIIAFLLNNSLKLIFLYLVLRVGSLERLAAILGIVFIYFIINRLSAARPQNRQQQPNNNNNNNNNNPAPQQQQPPQQPQPQPQQGGLWFEISQFFSILIMSMVPHYRPPPPPPTPPQPEPAAAVVVEPEAAEVEQQQQDNNDNNNDNEHQEQQVEPADVMVN